MKMISHKLMFIVGAAAGAGAYMGLEALNKNKYQVKKKINDTIDQVTSSME